MRLHRFFVDQPLGEELVLQEQSAARQLRTVFRAKVGEKATFFNGDGFDILYRITSISRDAITLVEEERLFVSLETHPTYLFLASIKKDLFEIVVEKATECGVTHIIPISSSRSIPKNLDFIRLKKISQEAAEQCGQAKPPQISTELTLDEARHYLGNESVSPAHTFFGSLGADTAFHSQVSSLAKGTPRAVFIGPEGGWTHEEEILLSSYGYTPVTLSPYTLRAETAAIICAYLSTQ